VTLALNMYTQGVDPEARLLRHQAHEGCLRIFQPDEDPERHPYVGELVYTAFSGSHQDAINKGMKAIKKANKPLWEVPYLPIDPQDVGRSYEAIIRINSQSGKGGIAYILQADYGINLPRNLQVEFREEIQRITDEEGKELPAKRIHESFIERYVDAAGARLKFVDHHTYPDDPARRAAHRRGESPTSGKDEAHRGQGHRPDRRLHRRAVDHLGMPMSVLDYSEHSLQQARTRRPSPMSRWSIRAASCSASASTPTSSRPRSKPSSRPPTAF
jgi:2-isopropylmalate synthase